MKEVEEGPEVQEAFWLSTVGQGYGVGRISIPRVLAVTTWPQVHVTGIVQPQAQHLWDGES